MISEEKIFGNFLADKEIITARLSAFAGDAHNRLLDEDKDDVFKLIRISLESTSATLARELSDVSGALGIQKGKTATVDAVMASFKSTMSDLEGVIAHALGGFSSEGYIAFYPSGVKEYSKATKTTLPTLMQRVADMGAKWATQLGSPLATQLQSFATDWKAARDAQQQQKGEVAGNRNERSAARIAAELTLLTLIHSVAAAFPGDVAACKRFFDFSLLVTGRTRRNAPRRVPTESKG